MSVMITSGITDYIKGGYLMRRAWKLYDKCYCEISTVGGPFLMWAPELRGEGNGVIQDDLDEGVEEALEDVRCPVPYNPTSLTKTFFYISNFVLKNSV